MGRWGLGSTLQHHLRLPPLHLPFFRCLGEEGGERRKKCEGKCQVGETSPIKVFGLKGEWEAESRSEFRKMVKLGFTFRFIDGSGLVG